MIRHLLARSRSAFWCELIRPPVTQQRSCDFPPPEHPLTIQSVLRLGKLDDYCKAPFLISAILQTGFISLLLGFSSSCCSLIRLIRTDLPSLTCIRGGHEHQDRSGKSHISSLRSQLFVWTSHRGAQQHKRSTWHAIRLRRSRPLSGVRGCLHRSWLGVLLLRVPHLLGARIHDDETKHGSLVHCATPAALHDTTVHFESDSLVPQ